MARFRLGNEMREGRYWDEEEEKVCRLCRGKKESWDGRVIGNRRRVEKDVGKKRVLRVS